METFGWIILGCLLVLFAPVIFAAAIIALEIAAMLVAIFLELLLAIVMGIIEAIAFVVYGLAMLVIMPFRGKREKDAEREGR